MERFKNEIAHEIGLTDYEYIDKGNLTSRENGYVGGLMVKRMVEAYERELANRRQLIYGVDFNIYPIFVCNRKN